MRPTVPFWTTLALLVAGCAAQDTTETIITMDEMKPALESITVPELLGLTTELGSDAFEGRAPATPGEERSVAWIADWFKQLGLRPGNPDGSWMQMVPMVGITTDVSAKLNVNGQGISLAGPNDYVAWTRQVKPEVKVDDSELVFVGYGIVAPEYGWDDFKGVDVKGKTLVMLVGDPPIPSASDPAKLDDKVFRGNAMTYYGRWTYKYQIAAEKGAAGAIIVHETGPAGYPFTVVNNRWKREEFDIKTADGNASAVAVQAWITEPKARELMKAAGKSYDELKQAALQKDFQPVALNGKVSFDLKNTIREVKSRNVVGLWPGTKKPDEFVIYTAHWDHLGRNANLEGDQILNGALDNASGVAMLLEIAQAYTKLPERPDRSMLFIALTGEEMGLLGAKYYAENPLYPLEKTLANINVDGMNPWGLTSDVAVVGLGNSTLDDILAEAAATQKRTLTPDPEPEKGSYYRSDHFEFAKKGVPALYADAGMTYIDKPADYGKFKRDEYTQNDYHKPTDEVKSDWDLAGAAQDAQLLFQVGYRVAQRKAWPEWTTGNEFKPARDKMLGKKPE